MLEAKIKPSEEFVNGKKLRNLSNHSSEEPKHKKQFFKNKMKEFINYHLDYAKHQKKYINQEVLQDLNQHENPPSQVPYHRKVKSQDIQKLSEAQNLKESLQNKITTLEKINTLINNVKRINDSLENIESQDQLHTKLSSSCQILYKIQDLINKDLNNYQLTLTLFDNYHQKQETEALFIKKNLQKSYENELADLTEKYEEIIQELTQHNKSLSENKHDKNLHQALKERIEYLEHLQNENDTQALQNIEDIKMKNSEIQSLKEFIDDMQKKFQVLEKQNHDLENYIEYQQENYQKQISNLTKEINEIKNQNQESVNGHQTEISGLKYHAENYKSKFDHLLSELASYENQLAYTKHQSDERENILINDNNELRTEVERLGRFIFGLKNEIDLMQRALDMKNIRKPENKDNEIAQLHELVAKLETESNQLIRTNKELNSLNLKLELKLAKAKYMKSLKATRSEKKIKPRK
ncbi:hypothetical protein SteCoe_6190 [Stentor coeruleus]|uniref:Uncharacterized protein n=1 Tax=Stentor coeruleus TaxID=5963 RepID=A0A1R2CQL6_9CILI|nr:hypothetical protein SteCoe_6190 [Stentor coeruleus]